MRELHFLRDVFAEKYGHALQRIPFDLHLSCPNRDRAGRGGCIFCAEDGSRAVHLSASDDLEEQARSGMEYAVRRYGAKPPYIAYFQAFTGTNAPVERLRELYSRALSFGDFRVVIIATRPDCLPEDVLTLLEEMNRRYEVWVELGVQTANDETLKKINRGHDFACAADAARRLHAHGISCAAHLILGLPGETKKDFIETARKIADLPFAAVKIHNLLVLKGTPLAHLYAEGECPVLNEYEYADALAEVIRTLPEDMKLMRLSAEAPEDKVIAPKWWMKKSQFLDFFKKTFSSEKPSRFQPCKTGDGSYTLYQPEYRQHFHSLSGAREESEHKYLIPCSLKERLLESSDVFLLDCGFGLGCNASAAIQCAERTSAGKLHIFSFELDSKVLPAALALPGNADSPLLQAYLAEGRYESRFVSAELRLGDARTLLQGIPEAFIDLVFLDAFSPDTNPELWTIDFLKLMKSKMKPGSALAAYSSAYPVLGALLDVGFDVRFSAPFGRRRAGTAAFLPPVRTTLDVLPEKDRNIALKSTAGIPYRDEPLTGRRSDIIEARAKEVAEKRASGMPKWFKTN